MDQPDKVVNSELPKIDQDKAVSPHAQEIEYALILQRMINVVNEDPEQMRLAIYQLARARLKADASWADEAEQKRLATALETAIQGVEKFSVNRVERERLQPAHPTAQIGPATPASSSSISVATAVPVTPAPEDILAPTRAYLHPEPPPVLEDVRRRALLSTLARFCVGMLLFVAVASLAYNKQQLALLGERLNFSKPVARPAVAPSGPDASQQASVPADAKAAERPPNPLPFPVPTDYGMYALNGGTLSELSALQERVPDKRIAMSTPVSEPSRTTLADGKARFILFRRDLAGNAPDRLLVQSEKPDFTLSPGRYVLVLKDQGYDFTVAGKITDVAQCLERTDAANGSFYSECQKP